MFKIYILFTTLRIVHILVAGLLVSSMCYCIYLILTQRDQEKIVLAKLMRQTLVVILPATVVQLFLGITMVSIGSTSWHWGWVAGGPGGVAILTGLWFGMLLTSWEIVEASHPSRTLIYIRNILLSMATITLFLIIFFMSNLPTLFP